MFDDQGRLKSRRGYRRDLTSMIKPRRRKMVIARATGLNEWSFLEGNLF
jgi:hypothetical protein